MDTPPDQSSSLETSANDEKKLSRSLEKLIKNFGIHAIVDTLVDIDNENWQRKLEPARHLYAPDGPFVISYEKATDGLTQL